MRHLNSLEFDPAIVKRTKLTEIEHHSSFVVKPYSSMETLSIPINELLEKAKTHTTSELAALYSSDTGTIYRILARFQVKAASAIEPISKEVLEEIFEEPTTVIEAAKQLHCTAGTITHAIKKFGLFGGGRKPTTKDKFSGFRAFKVLGYMLNHPEENLASIGRRFNCTREYVRQIKEAGIAEGIIKSWADSSDKFLAEAKQEGVEL